MTNALSLFVDHPQWLVVTGTVLLILGLTGLALFSPSVESTEVVSPRGRTHLIKKRNDRLCLHHTSKQVDDPEHLKVFATADAAAAWFAENDPEGMAFEYEVIGP